MDRKALLILAGVLLAGAGCSGGGGESAREISVLPVAADTLAIWVEDGRAVLFDIQPDSLYERGHLPMAAPAHGATVSELRDLFPVLTGVPLVVYNTDGSPPPPGEDLAASMIEHGFSGVYWLEGGLEAWVERGYNVDGSRLFPTR